MPSNNTNASDLDAKLNAEIEDALGDMSLDDIMAIDERPKLGTSDRQRKTGRVVGIHNDDVFVEFGPKSQGVCSLRLFAEPPAIGSEQTFIVQRHDPENNLLILTREGAVVKAEWESLEVGQVVEARCTGVNKGGLEMEVANHKAFMPAGQVDIRHVPDLSVFIGEKFPCEVVEVNRERQRIILSRRGPLEGQRKMQRDELLATLQPGMQCNAIITSVQQYGAFADIGGVDGLIHVSDLSYNRIKHPSEVVKVGDAVRVQVLKIDKEGGKDGGPKIGLGLKQLSADPVVTAMGSIKEGETVTGRVTRIADFGAFVEIAPGVEGLLHISELSHQRVNNVRNVVKPDEILTVKILSIDPGSRRISLSLKALQAKREEETVNRKEDGHMRKLKAQLNAKFGGNLKGGIG
ncbi:MAG TPA: S1 RNA-binding domain-containing protein [Phycisphaerales bacterium]|nr:S1 RNA-binding domain-containing protein [Phycisphaerales bacterium]